MEFASEMVVKAVLFQLKTAEVPCKLYPDGRERPPHLRSIPDGLRHLEFLLIYSPKWLFAYPGFIMTALGALIMLFLLIQPIHFGKVSFEVTTMLYSAGVMLIGYQMLQFAVFTCLFGKRIGQFPGYSGLIAGIVNWINRRGYVSALIFMLFGIGGVIYTLYMWAGTGFGELHDTGVYKVAIAFGSLLAIGLEMLLFTLFTRVLQMGGTYEKPSQN